jgi:hypothetical protein
LARTSKHCKIGSTGKEEEEKENCESQNSVKILLKINL